LETLTGNACMLKASHFLNIRQETSGEKFEKTYGGFEEIKIGLITAGKGL